MSHREIELHQHSNSDSSKSKLNKKTTCQRLVNLAKEQSQCCHDVLQRTERQIDKQPLSGSCCRRARFAAA